jgi:hypothetical protein
MIGECQAQAAASRLSFPFDPDPDQRQRLFSVCRQHVILVRSLELVFGLVILIIAYHQGQSMRCPNPKQRVASTCLALLFACGVVLFPAWHRARCGHSTGGIATQSHASGLDAGHTCASSAEHHAEHCVVCHLLAAPIAPACEALLAVPSGAFAAAVTAAVVAAPPRACHLLPYSCGPPA